MSRSALTASVRHLRGIVACQRHREDSDEHLLHAFTAHRDESAFAVLVRRHGPMVLHVCRRVLGHQQDAEDAFQATFLVLARNAVSLRNKSALASFLHGTAYRIALTAKRSATRRRKHEGQASARSSVNPPDELLWHEVRTLLDEEIARLPEIYRSVFVLCCLENLSQEEAGRRLGLKERTVSNRLAEARKRLQQRLTRRGVELSALLAATTVATETASALPAALLAKMSEGAVAPAVTALVEAGSAILSVSKAKVATVILLAVSLLGAAACGFALSRKPPAILPDAKADDKPRTAPSKPEPAKTVEIQGRVLGIDGQPKAKVKLLLLGSGDKPVDVGVSAADGRFTVAVPKEAKSAYLIARPDDAGMDLIYLGQVKPGKPVELRLVKDHAVRGRVVNTEGKPVPGVRVAIQSVNIYPNDSLDSFLIAWKKRRFMSGIPGGVKELWSETAALFAATTDAEGRFVVHGVGAERVASLRLSGAGIAEDEVWVVNRASFDPKPYNQATRDNIPKEREPQRLRWLLHDSEPSLVAEAEKPIHGVVKDADTGKGRAGVVVHLTRNGGALVTPNVRAKTDAQGRYEIHGARKAKSYMVEVASDPTEGYMACQVRAADTAGYQPLAADIRVKKGVIVTGKVIDGATGKSIPGLVEVAVLVNNPFAKDFPEFNSSGLVSLEDTADDGTFRLVTTPGPVLLMGGPDRQRLPDGRLKQLKYKPAVADPKYPRYFRAMSNHLACYVFGGLVPVQGNFCKVLDIKPGATILKQDIVLEQANALAVKIQDAEGRPLAGVWVTGISAENWHPAVQIADRCSVYGVEAGKPRLMVFYEAAKKLAGTLTLKGNEKQPVAVKLGPTGALKGRLLDTDGKPLAATAVEIQYRDREADEINKVFSKTKQVVTDANGAFALEGLIPEREFLVFSIRRGKPLVEEGSKPRDPIVHRVKPGETVDLGAIKLKPIPE